jgi:hypothetical protein
VITISGVALGFLGLLVFLFGFGLGAAVAAVQLVRGMKDAGL